MQVAQIGSGAALAGDVLVQPSANDGAAATVQMIPNLVHSAFLLDADFAATAAQFEIEDQRERDCVLPRWDGEQLQEEPRRAFEANGGVGLHVVAAGAVMIAVH